MSIWEFNSLEDANDGVPNANNPVHFENILFWEKLMEFGYCFWSKINRVIKLRLCLFMAGKNIIMWLNGGD